MSEEITYEQELEQELEKALKQNERLQKQVRKSEKWIERDEKLAARPRKSRLVTKLDLKNPKFIKQYPKASIGDEICDDKPLFWKLGLQRKPTTEQIHAQVAAQFSNDLKQEIEDGHVDAAFDDFEQDEPTFTSAEINAFLAQSAAADQHALEQATKSALPPAEQSEATGDEVTAKPKPKPEDGE